MHEILREYIEETYSTAMNPSQWGWVPLKKTKKQRQQQQLLFYLFSSAQILGSFDANNEKRGPFSSQNWINKFYYCT